jgi:hypothetical protein
MSYLTVEPIPTRNWKENLNKYALEDIREKIKLTKNQLIAKRKFHYLWFNYLRLCMNLEEVGYLVQRKKVYPQIQPPTYKENIKVIVNKDIYKDWSLNSLYEMKFHEWYKHGRIFNLFFGGGFELSWGGIRYENLVRKFNVFIEYQNRIRSDEYTRGDMTLKMKVSGDIFELYQKERFDDRKTFKTSQIDRIIGGDVGDVDNIILAVCEGRFTK